MKEIKCSKHGVIFYSDCWECIENHKSWAEKHEFVLLVIGLIIVGLIILGLRLVWAELIYHDWRCFLAECRVLIK